MRGESSGDVLKVWLYAASSVMLGAWMAPLFHNAGKALAEVSSVKQTNGLLEWIADRCRLADFPDFFVASLGLAAAVLFLPFASSLRGGRGGEGGKSPWRLRLPDGARSTGGGQRLTKNPDAPAHVLRGFLMVTGLFLVIGGVLVAAGVFEWRHPQNGWLPGVPQVLLMALMMAGLQEILFRGIALGIFLRALRPSAAVGASALLFALAHILIPPPGMNVADPEASGIGFELLRLALGQFSDPRMVFGTFAPLLALGGVLAFARLRTASLWLPIGLHAGWIFINGIASLLTVATSHPETMMWVISGTSLRQGIVPLVGILIVGALIDHLTATGSDAPRTPT